MNYLKDDYDDDGWNDEHDEGGYDEEAQDPSDYDVSSEEDEKMIKNHLHSDNEKLEEDPNQNFKEEEDELESVGEPAEDFTIFDLIPDNKKEELGLEDEFESPGIKPNTERITSPFISKYEKAMVIGKRAQQISKNSAIYVCMSEDEAKRSTALQIAEMEFETGSIPMIIRRYLPDRTFEDWKLKELKKLAW